MPDSWQNLSIHQAISKDGQIPTRICPGICHQFVTPTGDEPHGTCQVPGAPLSMPSAHPRNPVRARRSLRLPSDRLCPVTDRAASSVTEQFTTSEIPASGSIHSDVSFVQKMPEWFGIVASQSRNGLVSGAHSPLFLMCQ